MKLTHMPCSNCDSLMIWNEEEERYECKFCGYAEETKLRTFIPNYVT